MMKNKMKMRKESQKVCKSVFLFVQVMNKDQTADSRQQTCMYMTPTATDRDQPLAEPFWIPVTHVIIPMYT